MLYFVISTLLYIVFIIYLIIKLYFKNKTIMLLSQKLKELHKELYDFDD